MADAVEPSVASKRTRCRRVCFTLNNHTSEEVEALRSMGGCIGGPGCKLTYLCYGFEVGSGTGTPHVQGYSESYNALDFPRAWAKLLGSRCHLTICRGTRAQNVVYCRKDGEFSEFGATDAGAVKQLSPFDEYVSELVSNSREQSFDHLFRSVVDSRAGFALQWGEKLKKMYTVLRDPGPRCFRPHVFWLWGPPGVGKTRSAYDHFAPDVYLKNSSKWWDGYYWQRCVVLDDFRHGFMPFETLLTVLDRYPLMIEKKGESIHFNSSVIVVTSPHPPEFYCHAADDEDSVQLMRRLYKVVEVQPGVTVDFAMEPFV